MAGADAVGTGEVIGGDAAIDFVVSFVTDGEADGFGYDVQASIRVSALCTGDLRYKCEERCSDYCPSHGFIIAWKTFFLLMFERSYKHDNYREQ